ncbi:MAG: hydroxyisourate hydrolase [Isosphaeraceae bacterium]
MSPLTTHVLDIAAGKPARGIAVTLEIARGPGQWAELAHGVTDADGRIAGFVPPLAALEMEVYRLRFATGPYFKALGVRTFYPEVDVNFHVHDPAQHYHVPLLLSPFGYSTYRGS